MTTSMLEAALGIQFKQPDQDRPRVIRIPLKPPALPPNVAAERQVREELDQAIRRREELQVIHAFERLFPGRAIPAHYRNQDPA